MTESFMEEKIGIDIEVFDFRMIVRSIQLPEKTKSGFILPENMRKMESQSYMIGQIIGMGELAYTPKEKFCSKIRKIGDWVYYQSYERDKFLIGDHICYWINDERILGRVKEGDLAKIIPELERYK